MFQRENVLKHIYSMLIFSLILLFNRYKNCSLVSGPAEIKPVLQNKRFAGPNVLHVEKVFGKTVMIVGQCTISTNSNWDEYFYTPWVKVRSIFDTSTIDIFTIGHLLIVIFHWYLWLDHFQRPGQCLWLNYLSPYRRSYHEPQLLCLCLIQTATTILSEIFSFTTWSCKSCMSVLFFIYILKALASIIDYTDFLHTRLYELPSPCLLSLWRMYSVIIIYWSMLASEIPWVMCNTCTTV